MSSVWETRNRLLLEQLEKLTDQLRSEEPIGPAELKEQTVRLLAGVLMLLRQHEVNNRGQCRFCATSRWWRFWNKRPQCTVHLNLDFAMRQRMDVVWQRLLNDHKA